MRRKINNFVKVSLNSPLLHMSLLALFVFCVFQNILSNEFSRDDLVTVTNPRFVQLKDLSGLFAGSYFSITGEHSYRVFTSLSYLFDVHLWGVKPFGLHLSNLANHLINVLLLYWFLFQTVKSGVSAFFSALLFSVHPLVVEAVASIPGRSDMQVGLFLLCILNQFRLSLIYFFLALFAKENAVAILPALLTYQFYHEKNYKKLLPFCFIAGCWFFVYFYLLRNPLQNHVNQLGGGIFSTICTDMLILIKYVKMILIPVDLRPVYSIDILHSPGNLYFPAVIILILAIICFWKRFDRISKFSIAGFIFFLMPVMNLVPILNPIADRYMYIPLMFFFIFFSKHITIRSSGFAFLLICIYASITVHQIGCWKSDASITIRSLKYEQTPALLADYSNILNKRENYQEALDYAKKAIKLDPNNILALMNAGKASYFCNKIEDAAAYLGRAVTIYYPRNDFMAMADAWYGFILFKKGNLRDALKFCNKAIRVDENCIYAYTLYIFIALRLGYKKEAINVHNRALMLFPDQAELQF